MTNNAKKSPNLPEYFLFSPEVLMEENGFQKAPKNWRILREKGHAEGMGKG